MQSMKNWSYTVNKSVLDRRRPFEDDGETSLSVGTFCMMPELAFNPFIPRVCSVVTRRLRDSTPSTPKMQHIPLSIPEENYVSYDVYIAVLHILSDRVPGAEKAQLSFEVFDVADEGELDVMVGSPTFTRHLPRSDRAATNSWFCLTIRLAGYVGSLQSKLSLHALGRSLTPRRHCNRSVLRQPTF